MPTAEVDSRTHNKLPDIFRTINGINLDIGPFDRLRDSDASGDGVPWGRGEKGAKGRSHFPRIILRDALGHELDTFTTLQEAIYRAKWNVKQSGHPKEPLEWRLPKAPPPARPDLTRTFPPVKHPPAHPPDSKLKERFDSSRVLEFDVEDVGFVRESLLYLPYAPSLSFLRQEILVGPKTYFQIVGTLLLHKRFLSQTEKRNAIYNFPGFCTGCIRMGLCYGCERSTEIHFHKDKPVKTGGGFTYFKKDRPENEIKSKNPINWKIQHPDLALKKLMEEYAGVELEGPIPEEIKKHLDEHGGHRERIVSHIPDFAKEMKAMNNKGKVLKGDGLLPDIHVRYGEEDENQGELSEGEGHSGRRGHDLDVNDVEVHIQGQGEIDEEDGSAYYNDNDDGSAYYHGQQGHGRGRRKEQRGSHGSLAVSRSGGTNWSKSHSDNTHKSGYNTSDDESYRDGSYDRQGHRLPRYRREESRTDEENDEGEPSDTESGNHRRSRRKERLYKERDRHHTAPPPFKLKKSPKRSIVSKSPFSTDRVYDLPKGKAFEVKKSDKPPTKFKEFRNVDVSWKEPKKFELKKGDHKSTKFWSGPPKKKEKKTGGRSHGLRRVPSPRTESPDSGLDSEFLTAYRKQPPAGKFRNSDSVLDRKAVLEEEKREFVDRSIEPSDGDVSGRSPSSKVKRNKSGPRWKNKKVRKPCIATKLKQKVDNDLATNLEKSEDTKLENNDLNVDKKVSEKPLLEKKTNKGKGMLEIENDTFTSSEENTKIIESTDNEYNQSKVNKPDQRHNKTLRQRKKHKEKKANGELSLDESNNQSDESSVKLANQNSRYRSIQRQAKSAVTGEVLAESHSDSLSYCSTNQSTLDGFHDTATEYYKDFDFEAFQRRENLQEQLRTPRRLPSLADKSQAHFSVSILNTQKDAQPQKKRFSNQGGLSSLPSLKNSGTFSPIPGSPKQDESRLNGTNRLGTTPVSDFNKKQGLRQTGNKDVRNSLVEQKYSMYQPRSSAISPILYDGDRKPGTKLGNLDEDNLNETSEGGKRFYEGHITLSDLESETSSQLKRYSGDKRSVRSFYTVPKPFKNRRDAYNEEKGNSKDVIFKHLADQKDGQRKQRTRNDSGHVDRNIAIETDDVFPAISVVVSAQEGDTSLAQSNNDSLNSKKMSKELFTFDRLYPMSASNSSRRYSQSKNKVDTSRRNRSRSMILEYQKIYQQQQVGKSGSLPVVELEKKNDKTRGQRSLSEGHFTPYFGSPDFYDKHARGNSSKSRKSFSKGSKTSQNLSRAESVSEDLEDVWIKDRVNERKQMTLKVPTGRRESFMSTAQSHLSESNVDLRDEIKGEDIYEDMIGIENDRRTLNIKDITDEYGESTRQSNVRIHKAAFSPPLIPSDVDNEKGSLTSQEPDLELAFDDVIDVENLEVLEEEINVDEDTDKLRKIEKKKRHRHRKHKKRKDHLNTVAESEETASGGNTYDDKADQQKRLGFHDTTGCAEDENEKVDTVIQGCEKEYGNGREGHEDDTFDAVNVVARENSQEIIDNMVDNNTGKRRKFKKKKYAHGNADADVSEKMSRSRERKHQRSKNKKQTDFSIDSQQDVLDCLSEEETYSGLSDTESRERRHRNKKQAFLGDEHNLADDKNNDFDDFSEDDVASSLHSDNKHTRKDRKMAKKQYKHARGVGDSVMKEGTPTLDKDEFDEQKENVTNEMSGSKQTECRKKRSRDRKQQRKVKGKNSVGNSSLPVHRGRRKRRGERKGTLSDEEVDFDQLPSIKSQLAKILEIQGSNAANEVTKRNKSEEETEDETDQIDNKGSELNREKSVMGHKRPNSADRNNLLGVTGMNMKKYRSMSLPLLTDMEALLGNIGDITLEQLKAPLRVPVYLPSFAQGRILVKKQFKANPKRVKGREKRSMSISVVTLMPQLSAFEDTTNKSELEPVKEETLTESPDMGLSERGGTPLQLRVHSPAAEKPPRSVSPPKKREIVKKVKKPRSPEPSPAPPPKPPTPVKEKTPSPAPVEEKPVSREISFDLVKEKSIPELPPIEVPELPDIPEKQSEYKGIKKEKKLIEVTPEIPESKKKLPPPPKLGPRIKTRTSRKSKVAEAPVTTQELQQLSDPLDFLAKYCIINPDRLPYYERVFNGAVNIQTPRYTRDSVPGGMVHLPPAQLSEHELNMLRDITVITHAQSPRREGLSMPEQYLEKLNYSIEFIKTKQEAILEHMHELQGEKIRLMAQMAKELDRDIVRVDYKPKGGKKKKKDDEDDSVPKKKKKKKTDEPDYDTMGAMSVPKNFRPQRASDITDEVIVSRMDDKMMKKVKKDPTVKNFMMQISRDVEKLKHYDQRIAQIEDEKDLVGLYCMDYYFSEQNGSAPPYEFRRQQSRLYQKLHPDPDIEMNMEEVETALQQINNKLLSEKEFQYIYFILDLPKREKINFRLFSIIAALSEKVTQMDPVIRKLINKVDYNALDIKMDKSKELFELIQDESLMPVGNAPAETLAVELTAGGLTPEHTSYVLSKFNREGRGFVDFLDFVTYIPLFIEIHKRIIEDPFNETLDV